MAKDLMNGIRFVDKDEAQKMVKEVAENAKSKNAKFPLKKVQRLNDALVDYHLNFRFGKATEEEVNKRMTEIVHAHNDVMTDSFPIYSSEEKKQALYDIAQASTNLYVRCKLVESML